MSTRVDRLVLRFVVIVAAGAAVLYVGLVAGTLLGDGFIWLYDRFDPGDAAVWASALVLLAGATGGAIHSGRARRERMRIRDSD